MKLKNFLRGDNGQKEIIYDHTEREEHDGLKTRREQEAYLRNKIV